MTDLFDNVENTSQAGKTELRPLADRMRPTRLDEVVGQTALLAEDGPLRALLGSGLRASVILWGPPGIGKTTLARIMAAEVDKSFVQISAIFSSVGELKKIFDAARIRRGNGRGTVLFVDEIHRFNKAQLDSFLPVLEDGTITLIGATTENPSFELNAALLSRCEVLVLERLSPVDLELLAQRVEQYTGAKLPLTPEARDQVISFADGDGRMFLNLLDRVLERAGDAPLDIADVARILNRRAAQYDKAGDHHYNLISALHKSVRGSDPDAALYWFARMIEGGDDLNYLARRMTRMAVEDIGLADPHAMQICVDAWNAYERIGSPEGELALANALIYIALAPKSNAAYVAYKAARREAVATGGLMPPKHILNAPTQMMKDQGYGEGYAYDHDSPDAISTQSFFPDGLKPLQIYKPVQRGFERELAKRLSFILDRRYKGK